MLRPTKCINFQGDQFENKNIIQPNNVYIESVKCAFPVIKEKD